MSRLSKVRRWMYNQDSNDDAKMNIDNIQWVDWLTEYRLTGNTQLIRHSVQPWWRNVNSNLSIFVASSRSPSLSANKQGHQEQQDLQQHKYTSSTATITDIRGLPKLLEEQPSHRNTRSLSVDVTDLARRLSLLTGIKDDREPYPSSSSTSYTLAGATTTIAANVGVGSPLRQCFRPTRESSIESVQPQVHPYALDYKMTASPVLRSSSNAVATDDHTPGGEEKMTAKIRRTIKSHLQCAKFTCEGELQHVINGLNDYVERGLRYGNVDQVLHTAAEDTYAAGVLRAAKAKATTAEEYPTINNDEGEEADYTDLVQTVLGMSASAIINERTSSSAAMISEDSFMPTPFILALQKLIGLAQKLVDTPLDIILNDTDKYTALVAYAQVIGIEWEQHPEWPCRDLYVRLLLSIAAFNRAVEWWDAERKFWTTAEDQDEYSNNNNDNDDDDDDDDDEGARREEDISRVQEEEGRFNYTTRQNQQQNLDDDQSSQCTLSSSDMESDGFPQYDLDENGKNHVQQLQEAADHGQRQTVVMELDLTTATIQYLSPVWKDVTG